MKIHKERQYIVTVNSSYIRFLYDQQTGDKKPQVQILREILEESAPAEIGRAHV